MDHQKVYTTQDFSPWAYSDGLVDSERYVIDRYLDRNKSTIEAGTAGGRILLAMQKMGFTSLYGYDFVPEFIEVAKQRDVSKTINYEVQDATQLTYSDGFFEQIIYLQQILSNIEDRDSRFKAFKEAYRILKPGGIALFSFLNFQDRKQGKASSLYLKYINLLRKISGAKTSIQYLSRMKLGGKINYSALFDRGPYMYWYGLEEAYQTLTDFNFQVIAIGSDYQIKEGIMPATLDLLTNRPLNGMLYFVCRKENL
jgi:2-polyprenyl-3-methyl-5-hydroxy-6-metoxy-1,4-benzoquinol methylase